MVSDQVDNELNRVKGAEFFQGILQSKLLSCSYGKEFQNLISSS
jgi:hypothetical protein